MSQPIKYNNLQVALHWLSAVLVLVMLAAGSLMLAETPNDDPQKITALQGHMAIGGIVLLLTIFRLIWRFTSRQPAHASTGSAALDRIGILAHYLLYLLTLLVAASGIGIAAMAGLPDIVFSGQGELPASFDDLPPRIAHGILTKALALLIVLHVAAGLYHRLILKDGLFKRMSFKNPDA